MEQKGILALFGVVTSFIIGSISIPMIVLLILIILDYILGILAAVKEEKKFDASKAIWGAVKKVRICYRHPVWNILVDMLLPSGNQRDRIEHTLASCIFYCRNGIPVWY